MTDRVLLADVIAFFDMQRSLGPRIGISRRVRLKRALHLNTLNRIFVPRQVIDAIQFNDNIGDYLYTDVAGVTCYGVGHK